MSESPNMSNGRKEEESEGEDMDHDSDLDKTSSSDSSTDRSDESDSDMDEAEIVKRRTGCHEILLDYERQFSVLKEQLFRERCTEVDDKLFHIRSGRAQEYLQPLQQLQENMKIRTEVATILKQLSIASVQAQIEAEASAAQQNLQSEQKLLMDSIKEELENEIRRLEEDRNNIDVSSALCGTEQQPRRAAGAKRKPVSVSGPYIIYMLSDTDILSDLTVIKKALTASKRKSSVQ